MPRLSDLRPDEVADLFQTVQTVGNVIEKAYKAEALTIACQVRIAGILAHVAQDSVNFAFLNLGWSGCRSKRPTRPRSHLTTPLYGLWR